MSFIVAADSPTVQGVNVTLLAAAIAAGAGILAAVLSYLGVRGTRKAAEIQRDRDYRIRQLSELYGPLYMRRKLSRKLWRQLPGIPDAIPGVTKWNLIDHIEEIKGEETERRRLIVERILRINDELTEIIIGRAGLLDQFPPPESFEAFLEHAATLRTYWDRGKNATGVGYLPFPQRMDDDVAATIKKLRAAL
ncbi:hypothetical protein [Asanoa hainanensis]|nr:hypothetical protein [Asanoa hainanensis]